MGRLEPPGARTRVDAVGRELHVDRTRVLAELHRIVDGSQNRSVVENPVATAHDRLAGRVERVSEADSWSKVVLVNRVVLVACGKQRVVLLVERDDFEIV